MYRYFITLAATIVRLNDVTDLDKDTVIGFDYSRQGLSAIFSKKAEIQENEIEKYLKLGFIKKY